MPHLPKSVSLQEIKREDPFLGSMLPHLTAACPGDIYLVGGYLRDYFLGKIPDDVDFITFADPGEIASGVASSGGGESFLLDGEEKIWRVVIDCGGTRRTIDFSPVKGGSVEQDLSLRDFTINAMALDIERLVREGGLMLPRDIIDKHYGWRDLSCGILRECHDQSFLMDPLRLVRALRFRHVLGMEYEERTFNHLKKYAPLINRAAGERIAAELLETVLCPGSSRFFREFESVGLLRQIFPDLAETVGLEQNAYHHLDVWSHTLLTLEELDRILAAPESVYPRQAQEIGSRMKETLQDIYPRVCFLRLAALYHDAGKVQTFSRDGSGRIHFYNHQKYSEEATSRLAERLRLSRRAGDYMQAVVGKHMDIALSFRQALSPRRKRKMVSRLGEEITDVILLSTADRMATLGPLSSQEEIDLYVEVCASLLDEYERDQEIPPLIRGGDLIEELHLAQGPLIGEVLREVRMAQLEGAVSSREEALGFARDIMRSRDGK